MRSIYALLVVTGLPLISPAALLAQPSPPSVSVPRLVNITGVLKPADGQPPAAAETVTVSIYAEEEGGAPLWEETQTVALDGTGRYTVILGATYADGIPSEVFASGEAQWAGLRFARTAETEGRRFRITSVPYALRASDAETLGGRPPSAYLLAPPERDDRTATPTDPTPSDPTDQIVLPGTTNFLAKYVNNTDVGNSAVYETGGSVAIGTTIPRDFMHVQFSNSNGGLTGYSVQNLGNTTQSYSGMLFYDQNGALGQFQGFNNGTHEYRINNVARTSPGGPFNGSINFMTGNSSRLFVSTFGNIGLGTTSPASSLEVSNGLAPGNPTNILATSYGNTFAGPEFITRKARGTVVAPTAVQSGDRLGVFGAGGYRAGGFTGVGPRILMYAAENWTDTAQGAGIAFYTSPVGQAFSVAHMVLDGFGNVGIGTVEPASALDVAESGTDTHVFSTSFGGEPQFVTRAARGVQFAPEAVLVGTKLGVVGAAGFHGSGFSELQAGMRMFAAENWTGLARGTALAFATTPIGGSLPAFNMGITPLGNVGIGTPSDGNGLPTALDRLQVFGDIRVGTGGSGGCVKDFTGSGLVGTCASDRRFKRDITPFGNVLGQLTALQPVHYFWRAADFPDRHFGDSRAYGLIAQQVEQVLPELVVTGDDGFKAVDYSKLPLLTIQAVKELKSENDALKERVAELERLITQLLTTASRQ